MLIGVVHAGAQSTEPTELRARRATTSPKIDGILDDEVWSGDPLPLERWVSYNPLRGSRRGNARAFGSRTTTAPSISRFVAPTPNRRVMFFRLALNDHEAGQPIPIFRGRLRCALTEPGLSLRRSRLEPNQVPMAPGVGEKIKRANTLLRGAELCELSGVRRADWCRACAARNDL